MDPVIAPLLGFLGWLGIGAFQAFTCEKEVAFHRENTPKLERRIAELEGKEMESVSTIARLEHDKRAQDSENSGLRKENKSFREQLAAARSQHQTLIASQAKISKDTQADLEDRGKWFDKELQKRQDLVDNTNITRWHEKTEYGKKLAEYQRLLNKAAAESGGLRKEIAQVNKDLGAARRDLGSAQSNLATAKLNLDKMKQDADTALAEKDAKHQQDIQRYRLAVTGLAILFAVTLIALIFVLLRRRRTP